MHTPYRFGAVALEQTLPVLARSKRAVASMTGAIGKANATEAIRMLETGKLTGSLGDTIHDFFLDEIANQAQEVWSGSIPGSEDAYPVKVMEYEGVYFVWALEYAPAGYFLRFEGAKEYVFGNWEGVETDSE
jgi:hypothetical protein